MLTAISRAELDPQIPTAHAYPRSLRKFVESASGLPAWLTLCV